MIYAIRAVGTEYIKFGFTMVDVKARLQTLQTGCPLPLEVVATCRGDQETETWIHWRLFKAKAHHMGEWFKDCDEVKKVLFEMLAEDLKPKGVPADVVKTQNLKDKRLGRIIDFSERTAGGWKAA